MAKLKRETIHERSFFDPSANYLLLRNVNKLLLLIKSLWRLCKHCPSRVGGCVWGEGGGGGREYFLPWIKISFKSRPLLKGLLFRTRGYKTCFMLNSVEHEISNAPKYVNMKTIVIFRLR